MRRKLPSPPHEYPPTEFQPGDEVHFVHRAEGEQTAIVRTPRLRDGCYQLTWKGQTIKVHERYISEA